VARNRGPYGWLTPVRRRLVEQRLMAGERPVVVAAEVGCHVRTVQRAQADLLLRRRVSDSGFRLSFEERVEIAIRVARGERDSEIARALGRHRSTIGREIRRARDRGCYRPWAAQRKAARLARRPRPTKLARNPRLLAAVEAGLQRRWSPQQISARLRVQYPDDAQMRISHETIYQSLYVQSRGELRRQLTAQLRTGRRRRKPQGRQDARGRIADMIPIAERPPEVDDRRVPGHWEGDLLLGAGGKSAIATLVERQTRYVLLAQLGRDQTPRHVIQALQQRIQDLPRHLVKSLTWDQGRELRAHKQFTNQTGIQIYFCDPHSPWQRGSNENTNGLLRQYLPKGTDLANRTQHELDQIAAELNGRPRQTLKWQTPAERMERLLR
jgi:transposase, IS30 family